MERHSTKMENLAMEMKQSLIAIAGPRNTTIEAWLSNAARRIGISYRMARAIWDEDLRYRRPRADVVDLIRSAQKELNRQKASITSYEMEENDGDTASMLEELKAAHRAIGALLARYGAGNV